MGRYRKWRERLAVSRHRSLLVIFLGQLTAAVDSSSTFPIHQFHVQSLGSVFRTETGLLGGQVGLPEPTIEAVST